VTIRLNAGLSVGVVWVGLSLLAIGCGGGSGTNPPDAAATGGISGGNGGSAATGRAGAKGTGGSAAGVPSGGSGGAIPSGTGGSGVAGAKGTGGSAAGVPSGGSGGAIPSGTGGSGVAGASGGGSSGTTDAPAGARCPTGPFPQPTMLSSKDVCGDFPFKYDSNEGPTWIASQSAFFFSNYAIHQAMGGDIIKYTPGGACEVFIAGVGCNGLAVTNDGNLVAACQQSRSVVRFDITTKQATTVADGYMGMMLDSPNDLVVHSNGTIYFTNPTYELGGRPPGVGLAVFRVDPTGIVSLIMKSACNGIALSPDEKLLYVLQAGVWDLDPQGVPSDPRPLFTGGDGMAVDCAGNLYASGTIFSPAGDNLGAYVSGGTNLAFGGPDSTTVLVVGRGTMVRELQMNVPGLP
jgi:gluconolactonase